jgi:putative chitobiose transport system substrate-binding protein
MTNTRRWIAVGCVAGLPVLAGVPASCERAQSGPREGLSTPAERTVEVWTLALRPWFDDYLRETFSQFEAAHPGVRVVWVDVPFDAIDRKLVAAAAAGRAPDVINLSDRTFARYVGLGAMTDLRALVPEDPGSVFFPGALNLGKIDGKLLALPWYLTTQVGMVNTRLLEAGGLDATALASTWSELRRQAIDYHARTGKHLFSLPLGTESQLPILLLSEGLPPLVAGADGRLQPDLLRPEIVAFIDAWVQFYRSGAMPQEAATRDHGHLTDLFKDGKLATIDTGPNFLKRVRDTAPEVFASTELRPPITGALGRAHIATMILGVTTQSKEPALATMLAWHMTSAERQARFCERVSILPSTPESLSLSRVFAPARAGDDSSAVDKPARGQALAAASLSNAVAFTPAHEAWPDLRRSFEDGIKRALLRDEPTRVTLERINEEWRGILAASASTVGMDAVPTPGPVSAPPPGATGTHRGRP